MFFSRMLFITDYGNVAKLERCNMDGSNRTRLVDYKIEQPTAVALDMIKKLVYWADAYLDYIDVVDYHGRNRHTIIHGIQVSVTFYCKHSFFPSTLRSHFRSMLGLFFTAMHFSSLEKVKL